MQEKMTRKTLRALVDPELIGEIETLPIRPAKIGNYIYHRELMWKRLIIETILPHCRSQIRALTEHDDLLTDSERELVKEYKKTIAEYEEHWRDDPFSFPSQPKGFDKILLD